jgi:hypothetical protein
MQCKFSYQKSNNVEEKKNSINKNQGWEPIHRKYKAKENTSRHNPKEKQR